MLSVWYWQKVIPLSGVYCEIEPSPTPKYWYWPWHCSVHTMLWIHYYYFATVMRTLWIKLFEMFYFILLFQYDLVKTMMHTGWKFRGEGSSNLCQNPVWGQGFHKNCQVVIVKWFGVAHLQSIFIIIIVNKLEVLIFEEFWKHKLKLLFFWVA